MIYLIEIALDNMKNGIHYSTTYFENVKDNGTFQWPF